MNNLSTSAIILLSEANLLLLITIGVATAVYVRRRQRDNDGLNRFAAQLKSEYQTRLDGLRQRLKEQRGLGAEDGADQKALQLVQAEYKLYKRFMEIYARRDSAAISDLHAAVVEVVSGYENLPAHGAVEADVPNSEQLQPPQDAAGKPDTGEDRNPEDEMRAELDRVSAHDIEPGGRAAGMETAQDSEEKATGEGEEEGASPGVDPATAAEAMDPEPTGDGDEDASAPEDGADPADDNYDEELENLNLDEIDLGLDKPTRQTG